LKTKNKQRQGPGKGKGPKGRAGGQKGRGCNSLPGNKSNKEREGEKKKEGTRRLHNLLQLSVINSGFIQIN